MALSQDQLLAVLDRHVLVAERKVKTGLALLESAEKQESEAHRKAEYWLGRFDDHEGTEKKADLMLKKAKVAQQICNDTQPTW